MEGDSEGRIRLKYSRDTHHGALSLPWLKILDPEGCVRPEDATGQWAKIIEVE